MWKERKHQYRGQNRMYYAQVNILRKTNLLWIVTNYRSNSGIYFWIRKLMSWMDYALGSHQLQDKFRNLHLNVATDLKTWKANHHITFKVCPPSSINATTTMKQPKYCNGATTQYAHKGPAEELFLFFSLNYSCNLVFNKVQIFK